MLRTLLVRLNPGSLPPLSVCKDRLAARSFFFWGGVCFCCSSVTASCMSSLCGFTVVLPSPVILESVAALSFNTLVLSPVGNGKPLFHSLALSTDILFPVSFFHLHLLFSHLWQQSFPPLFCSLAFGNSHFLHSFVLLPLATVIFSTLLFSRLWQQSFSPLFCSLAFGNSHFLHSFVLSPLATVIFSTLLSSRLWQQSFSPLFCSLAFGNSHFLHSFVLSPLASHFLHSFVLSPLATVIFSTLLFSRLWQLAFSNCHFPLLLFSRLWQLSFPPPFHSLTFGSQQSFSPLFPPHLWHDCHFLVAVLTCGITVWYCFPISFILSPVASLSVFPLSFPDVLLPS